jgi:hypothetical protein
MQLIKYPLYIIITFILLYEIDISIPVTKIVTRMHLKKTKSSYPT